MEVWCDRLMERISQLIQKQIQNRKTDNIRDAGQLVVGRNTEIFNEGWLLKLVLETYQRHKKIVPDTEIDFSQGLSYFTEAQLTSPFLRGDDNEDYTNADAVVGEYWFSAGTKAKIQLHNGDKNKSRYFSVIEAKMKSPISKNIQNAKNYNQVARTIVCMINMFKSAGIEVCEMEEAPAYYVFAPDTEWKVNNIEAFLPKETIINAVKSRFDARKGLDDLSFEEVKRNINKLLNIPAKIISWERLLNEILCFDPKAGKTLIWFYKKCCEVTGSMKRHLNSNHLFSNI